MRLVRLLGFLILLSAAWEAKAAYPTDVCAVVATLQPGAICIEPESRTWATDQTVNGEASLFMQRDSLLEQQQVMLEHYRTAGNCPECQIITSADLEDIGTYNQPFDSAGVKRIPYTRTASHDTIWNPSLAGYLQNPDSETTKKLIIGRVEYAKKQFGTYGIQSYLFKVIYVPQAIPQLNYLVQYNLVYSHARCAPGENLMAPFYDWDPNQTTERIFFCEPNTFDLGALDGGSSLDTLKEGCSYGCNPVNLATGTKLGYSRDYQNYSSHPIVLERWYHSGKGGWTFGHERHLRHYRTGDGNGQTVVLWRPDGTKIHFSKSGTTWTNPKLHVLGRFSSNESSTSHRFAYINLGDQTEFYDSQGRLTEIRELTGQKISFSYNAFGEMDRIEDDFGRHLELTYSGVSPNRYLSQATDGQKVVNYEFEVLPPDSANLWAGKTLLKKVTYPDTKTVQYLYDEGRTLRLGLLTGIVREDGERYATYLYDNANRVMQTQHGQGLDTTDYAITPGQDAYVGWGSNGTLFPLTNPMANGLDKTSGSTAPCPNCGGTQGQAITYDPMGSGAVTQLTGFDGVATSREVDTQGRVSQEIHGDGTAMATTTFYGWHGDTRLPASVTEQTWTNGFLENRQTTFTYDTQNRLISKTVAAFNGEPSRSWAWTYNSKGQVLTASDPISGTTTFSYDPISGNLLTTTNALGHVTSYGQYTANGKPGKVTNPNGLETEFTYDARDRITQVRRGKPSLHWETMTIDYTDYGSPEKVTYPDGTWVEYAYDSAHRLVEIKDQRGRMELTLNNDGDVTQKEVYDLNDVRIGKETTQYDQYRRLQTTVDGNNAYSNVVYSGLSEQVSYKTDPDYLTTPFVSFGYDALGQPAHTSTGHVENGRTTQTQHAPTGQLKAALDGNWVQTTFTYNAFGDLIGQNSPDGGSKSFEFNAAGLMTQVTDGRGATSATSYDALGRPTETIHTGQHLTPAAANETQTLTYDTCTHGIGKVCTVTDHSGQTAYAYDVWGRVTQKTFTPSTGFTFSLMTSYAYNTAGQLVSVTYSSGNRVDYTYDKGEITSIEYDFQPVLEKATYRPLSREILGWNWGGFSGGMTFTYDLAGRLSRIQDVDDRHYGRNKKGWITSITDPNDPDADQLYTYSQAGFLKQANLAARPYPIDYFVDENDNVISRTLGPEWEDELFSDYYTNYGVNNRPFIIYDGWEEEYTPIFDGNGNMVDDGENLTLVYDAKGRVRSTARLGYTTSYAYNAMGQRMRKSDSTLSTGHRFYAYDEAGRVLGEYDGAGQALEEYVYLDGHRPVAVARNLGPAQIPVVHPILTDHLGTPRKVLSPAGATLWSWDAKDPYGYQAPNEWETSVSFRFDLRFPGQRYDQETGLYHNGFRDYSPKYGRYAQADPIGLNGGWNIYVYAGSNPINLIDFNGLKFGNGFDDPLVQQALSYLSQSPAAREIINYVYESNRTLNIKRKNGVFDFSHDRWIPGIDIFKRNEGTVTWDPYTGLWCDSSGKGISPALALLHEMAHFLRSENFEEVSGNARKRDQYFGTREEAIMVRKYEWRAALELGELVRKTRFTHPEVPGAIRRIMYINPVTPHPSNLIQ